MEGLVKGEIGKKGEDIAAGYVKRMGYRIIERNYRCRWGEIDIIAQDGDTIVFIEVKSRRSECFGDPECAVDMRKQKKLCKISLAYLKEKNLYPCNARFDVVTVKVRPTESHVELIQNAFTL